LVAFDSDKYGLLITAEWYDQFSMIPTSEVREVRVVSMFTLRFTNVIMEASIRIWAILPQNVLDVCV